jgi:hypothetical protein
VKKLCLVSICLYILLAVASVQAGTIVLSGDVTPSYSLTDTGPNLSHAGNIQFFTNLLNGGDAVAVVRQNSDLPAWQEIDEFYAGITGVTSTVVSEISTSGIDLNTVDLLIAPLPGTAFSGSDVDAISDFLSMGGTAFFMGDSSSWSESNGIINDALTSLGSGLGLTDALINPGQQIATSGAINPSVLTTGVTSFAYGSTSIVSGGTPIIFAGLDQPFIAFETLVKTATVNIDAAIHGDPLAGHTPVSINLIAGHYQATLVNPSVDSGATFTAWNPWAGEVAGWRTDFIIAPATGQSTGGGYQANSSTAQEAFNLTMDRIANFHLSSNQSVDFYVQDAIINDNQGGVSLRISHIWGDINDDGEVNVVDVLLATENVFGAALSDEQLTRGNVAPLVNGVPQPSDPLEPLGAADLLLITQKAIGAKLF